MLTLTFTVTKSFSQEYITHIMQVGETLTIEPTGYYSLLLNGVGLNGDNIGGGNNGVLWLADSSHNKDYHVELKALAPGYATLVEFTQSYSVKYWTKIHFIRVVEVKSISIPQNISLSSGDTFTFQPYINEVGAATAFSWSSSNSSVASLNGGVLTAHNKGWTVVTCTAANGVFAQSFVVVSPVYAQKLTLNEGRREMAIGEEMKLLVSIKPDNASQKEIKWLSSNENIAQVDNDGVVTAISSGYCDIFAQAADGSGVYDKCLVHVKGNEPIEGDVDKDGKVTVTDAAKVVDIILKSAPSWPIVIPLEP